MAIMPLPEEFVTRDVVHPKGIFQVFTEYYWWCVDGDPQKAVFLLEVKNIELVHPSATLTRL